VSKKEIDSGKRNEKMQRNYNSIKTLLRKYSFEFLKVSNEPFTMLDHLDKEYPEIIQDAQNLNLLAAAIVTVYLKDNDLSGRGKEKITKKSVAEYFEVSSASLSEKYSAIHDYFWHKMAEESLREESYEYIDMDRFEVNEMYWEFIASEDAEHITNSIKILKKIIKKDPDYFDPYITLHEYYHLNNESVKAYESLGKGYQRALRLIIRDGRFPDELLWGFIENRHIIRMLFNFAIFMWMVKDKDDALDLMLQLLHADTMDNIGARYSIVAILEGLESQEDFEEKFLAKDGDYLDWEKQERWFHEKAKKHEDVLGWWLNMEDELT
jgi:tetratricopeptide (TPR) repeat protein